MTSREQQSLQQRWDAYLHLTHLTPHWYWRTGWRPGRSFYTWHLTFAAQTHLHSRVRQLQTSLEDLPGLDLVPLGGLHLTMQGLGFTDGVDDDQVTAIVDATRARCRAMEPFELQVGPVDPDAEGIGLLISPWEPVERLRGTVRDAIASVCTTVPEPDNDFRPHVTLAYSGADVPTPAIRDRLAALRDIPAATTTITDIQLIALRRDERVYRWELVANVPLGTR